MMHDGKWEEDLRHASGISCRRLKSLWWAEDERSRLKRLSSQPPLPPILGEGEQVALPPNEVNGWFTVT